MKRLTILFASIIASNLTAMDELKPVLQEATAVLEQKLESFDVEKVISCVVNNKLPHLIDTLQDSSTLLDMLNDVQSGNNSIKTKIASWATSIPTHTLHQAKGFVFGVAYSALAYWATQKISPTEVCNLDPYNLGLTAATIVSAYGLKKLYDVLYIPTSALESLALKLANLGLAITPWIPVVCQMLKISPESLNNKISAEALRYYKSLMDTLQINQKDLLSKPYMLALIALDASLLVGELDFLKSLDNDQLEQAYLFLEAAKVAEHANYNTFKSSLNNEQLIISAPQNRCLIASYNPLVLTADETFMNNLTSEQIELLVSMAKK